MLGHKMHDSAPMLNDVANIVCGGSWLCVADFTVADIDVANNGPILM